MKTLPSHIKPKPYVWNCIPWLAGSANTIYPYIYLPQDIYTDLQDSIPSAQSLATLIHEETHLARQKTMGIFSYALRYVLSRHFRYSEELVAIAPQIKLLHEHGITFDIKKRAKLLASKEYGWCASNKKALQDLEQILLEQSIQSGKID